MFLLERKYVYHLLLCSSTQRNVFVGLLLLKWKKLATFTHLNPLNFSLMRRHNPSTIFAIIDEGLILSTISEKSNHSQSWQPLRVELGESINSKRNQSFMWFYIKIVRGFFGECILNTIIHEINRSAWKLSLNRQEGLENLCHMLPLIHECKVYSIGQFTKFTGLMYFLETKHQHVQESCVFPTAPTACLYSLSTIDRLAATFQLADMAGDIQGSSDQTAKPKPHTVVV